MPPIRLHHDGISCTVRENVAESNYRRPYLEGYAGQAGYEAYVEVGGLERLAGFFVYHVTTPSEIDSFQQAARVVPQVVTAR